MENEKVNNNSSSKSPEPEKTVEFEADSGDVYIGNEKTIEAVKTQIIVDQKKTVEVDKSMVEGSIENIAANGGKVNKEDEKPKSFLTKKKVILASVFLVISVVLIALTLRFILNIQWNDLFVSIGAGLERKIGYLWFFLFLCLMVFNVFRGFITIIPRFEKIGCHIKLGDWILYSITICFLSTVTPAAIISDPYTVFWMKTHGVSTSKCASVMFTNSLFWQLNQIIINLVPFILVCVYYKKLAYPNGVVNPTGKAIFWLIVIGFGIDWITLVLCYFMCVSKRFHYIVSRIYNWFKKIFRMKYHTKAEISEKYKEKAVIKQDYHAFMKDRKTTFLIIGLFVIGDVIGTLTLALGLAFVQYIRVDGILEPVKVGFNTGWMFVCARLSIMCNRLNFLPGAALGYEWSLSELGTILGGWAPLPSEVTNPDQIHRLVVNNGVLTVRFFTGYVPALVGLGGFVALTVQQVRLSKKGRLIQNKY